jgi:hypothetical protein
MLIHSDMPPRANTIIKLLNMIGDQGDSVSFTVHGRR